MACTWWLQHNLTSNATYINIISCKIHKSIYMTLALQQWCPQMPLLRWCYTVGCGRVFLWRDANWHCVYGKHCHCSTVNLHFYSGITGMISRVGVGSTFCWHSSCSWSYIHKQHTYDRVAFSILPGPFIVTVCLVSMANVLLKESRTTQIGHSLFHLSVISVF